MLSTRAVDHRRIHGTFRRNFYFRECDQPEARAELALAERINIDAALDLPPHQEPVLSFRYIAQIFVEEHCTSAASPAPVTEGERAGTRASKSSIDPMPELRTQSPRSG